ncbi:MAG: DUF4097 family beta strand repeat protein [Gemmatimonadetes bacterium]|nr:DUF4097 family beta strand repeat protein [Gemmatimonadota bacterium]
MIGTAGFAALAALSLLQQTDTVIPVSPGARLEIDNQAGEVVIRSWGRPAVRVVASHASDDRIKIRSTASVVRVDAASGYGPQRSIDYHLSVPQHMAVYVTAPFSDVSVEGAGGEVSVETVRGEIRVRGGAGRVSLRSVEGLIELAGARGRVEVNTVNEGIRVVDVRGELSAETVNGDIELERIDSDRVVASTVNGNISYSGAIRDRGWYRLATHNGDVRVEVAEKANATVTVATFNGEFESTFPVLLREARGGKRFNFVLGSGSARLELESFNGEILLRRPGARGRNKD